MTLILNYINPITDKVAQYIPSPIKTALGSLNSRTVQFFSSGSYGAIAGVTALNVISYYLIFRKIALSYRNLIELHPERKRSIYTHHKIIALTAGAATFALNEIFNRLTGYKFPFCNTRYISLCYSLLTTVGIWCKLHFSLSSIHSSSKNSSSESSSSSQSNREEWKPSGRPPIPPVAEWNWPPPLGEKPEVQEPESAREKLRFIYGNDGFLESNFLDNQTRIEEMEDLIQILGVQPVTVADSELEPFKALCDKLCEKLEGEAYWKDIWLKLYKSELKRVKILEYYLLELEKSLPNVSIPKIDLSKTPKIYSNVFKAMLEEFCVDEKDDDENNKAENALKKELIKLFQDSEDRILELKAQIEFLKIAKETPQDDVEEEPAFHPDRRGSTAATDSSLTSSLAETHFQSIKSLAGSMML